MEPVKTFRNELYAGHLADWFKPVQERLTNFVDMIHGSQGHTEPEVKLAELVERTLDDMQTAYDEMQTAAWDILSDLTRVMDASPGVIVGNNPDILLYNAPVKFEAARAKYVSALTLLKQLNNMI